MAMKPSLFNRLQSAVSDANRRVMRRNEAMRDLVHETPEELRFSPEFLQKYKQLDNAHTEAYDTYRKLYDAEFAERLSNDIENATGDGARFRDDVINFVGPRQPYHMDYVRPQHVTQKKIRNTAYDRDAYNLNEIPGTIQDKFIDGRDRAMHPEETMYSTGVYGLNGKYFKNRYGDEFYVPNRSSEVFRR